MALIILFVAVGIILLLLEIFFLPGITIGGIAGTLFLVAAVWLTFATYGSAAAFYTIAGIVVLLAASIVIFIKSGIMDKISLKTEIQSKVETNVTEVVAGQSGIAVSRLAPIGKADIEGVLVEVKSISGFVDENTDILVVSTENNEILVKTKN